MSFVHLHTHSHYSMLDGLGKVEDLVGKAVSCGMPALALTDHGNMYGAVEFYQKCKKAGIKPIIGVEAYVARNGHLNKRAQIDSKPYHLILLVKNETGYRNLIKLTSIAYLDGFYYKPRIDFELLRKYHEGLICSTACLYGELPSHIVSGNLDLARGMIRSYQDLFGRDSFYLEVQHHPSLENQKLVNEKIFELSAELNVPVIATNDIHYPEVEDGYAQDVLLCIQTKRVLADTDRLSYIGVDLSFKSSDQMKEDFKDHPEAIQNTLKIAQQIDFELKLGQTILPLFPLPGSKDANDYLKDLCHEGLEKRYGENANPEILKRMDYELEIIARTGYAGYFLIVADFINWAKDNGIVVGPGRGSAAGSLVAYLTKITNIDPMAYKLVFERFLNPERISMPDIDTDFADSRRDDVLRYVSSKYGKDQVAQIITFGTMAARNAIRDVGRVMGLPYNYCDRAAKLVPMFAKLGEAVEKIPEFKEILAEEKGERLIKTARRLEGVVRHASTHACGVVITPDSLDNYAPRQYGSAGDESIVIQYEMHAVESLGLLKMDFLGLSNLTIIEQTLEIIEKIHGVKIDINDIPLNDVKSLKIFQQGKTTGVFQFESAGMKRYLKQLMPTDFEDIIAMVALYRPGPMEYIPDYIAGKHGKKKPQYLHPKLKPILEGTYGVAVYQEQLLQIARNLAGFSYGEADILRKAVGKKIKALLAEQEVKLIKGMVENGIEKKTAEKVWEFILPFAAYGFNRSHAACYALIAYQTAFLKANYPAEFMAALLTSDQQNSDRIAIEAEECRQMGIEVSPPDINESFSTFTVVAESLKTEKPRIRFGLLAIKGLGENIVKEIIKERKQNGKFNDLADFLSRIKTKDLNKRSLDAMIKSGCLDSLGERNQLLTHMDLLLSFIQEASKNADSGQDSLFGSGGSLPALNLSRAEPLAKRQKLNWEKEYLGLYVSEHPLSEFGEVLAKKVISCGSLKQCAPGSEVRVAGVITVIKKIQTKKGDNMVFAKIEDDSGSVEILVFSRILEQNPHLWLVDNIIACSGKISDKDDDVKILCDCASVLTMDNIEEIFNEFAVKRDDWKNGKTEAKSKKIRLTLQEPIDYSVSVQLKKLFFDYPGFFQIEIVINRLDGNRQKVKTNFRVGDHPDFLVKAESLIGEGNISLDT